MGLKIIFIIGGARSGKSSFALNEASKIKGQKVYIATAEALDGEMRERIEKHKKNRGEEWDTIEEPLKVPAVLSQVKDRYNIIVLDCLTLWLSNILHRKGNIEDNIKELIDELEGLKDASRITHHASQLYIVSNEVGMGIVPDNELVRRFRDLAGFLNQKVAELADEVYLIVSGLPVRIK
jgi:adenosyl cobinamide kinase/adenosyl cobinamide phosphate guanylyltransferase